MDMDKLGYFVYMQSQEQGQNIKNKLLPQNNIPERQQLERSLNAIKKNRQNKKMV